MFSQRWFLFVCLLLLISGGMMSGVGFHLTNQMTRLQAEGVEATATVDLLRSFRSGSRNNQSTTYRAGFHVERNDRRFDLIDDLGEAEWRALSEGDCVAVVFAPDGSGLCLVGSMADVAEAGGLARWLAIAGVTTLGVAGLLFGWAWLSLGMPSFRAWANGVLPIDTRNPYAAA